MTEPPSRPFLLAIDGPAGAGKSTVSRKVAHRLGFSMIDTGALYRAVALAARRAGIAYEDEAGLEALLRDLDLRLEGSGGEGSRVFLGGEDVSSAIRTPEISLGASRVSTVRAVREGLLELQRRLGLAAPRGAVLEGRDIGTVVFPDADAKIFLTASVEQRARRRYEELRARGEDVAFDEVLADQIRRDRRDMERALAPLRPAEDAFVVDSTGRTIDEVVDEIVRLTESRIAERGSRG
jgi:cytidylate kinase